MIFWPQLMIIAGTDCKVGKTTLACQVIDQLFRAHQPVIGIKITSHFHELPPTCDIIQQSKSCIIALENSKVALKDSSRMLAAGAKQVFYIQSTDVSLPGVIEFLQQTIVGDVAVVCESAALRRYVEPGIFLLLTKERHLVKNLDLVTWADAHLHDFHFNFHHFQFSENRWKKIKKG